MNTNNKILVVSTLCLMCTSPVWAEMNDPAPITVTIEKQADEMKQEFSQREQNASIVSKVRVAFKNIPGFVEDKVMIKADKGVITLTGNVADEKMKAAFEKEAKSVAGVDSVKNELKVDKK